MICQYRYDPSRDGSRFAANEASTAIRHLLFGYALDSSLKHSIQRGITVLERIKLAKDRRVSSPSTFSVATIEAEQFLKYIEHRRDGVSLINDIDRMVIISSSVLGGCAIEESDLSDLRDYFRRLADCFPCMV